MKKINSNNQSAIRINKYMSDAGFCSRRQADRYLEKGLVFIDGRKAVLGDMVNDNSKIYCNGVRIKKDDSLVILAVNKPGGIVCSTRHKDNIVDFINYGTRVYPVGRLDKDSEGLILLTNDGELMNRILRPGFHHEKEYEVVVNKPITETFLSAMSSGVKLTELNVITKKCKVEKISEYKFRIILTQGLNRQIRRMCEELDYKVRELKRVRILNIKLGRLKLGEYRELSEKEVNELINQLIE